MPRIPHLPADIAEPAEIVAAVRARRGGRLLNLDRMLLHSPSFNRGWNAHLGAVRRELTLEPPLRELAICAVAALNHDVYEHQQHAPEFLAAGGSAAQLEALRGPEAAARDSALFDAAERAAIGLAVEMTRRVAVSDATFAAARAAFPSERQVVELVGVIATFNMVSRFLLALGAGFMLAVTIYEMLPKSIGLWQTDNRLLERIYAKWLMINVMAVISASNLKKIWNFESWDNKNLRSIAWGKDTVWLVQRQEPAKYPFGFANAHVYAATTHRSTKIIMPVCAMKCYTNVPDKERGPRDNRELIGFRVTRDPAVPHMFGWHL